THRPPSLVKLDPQGGPMSGCRGVDGQGLVPGKSLHGGKPGGAGPGVSRSEHAGLEFRERDDADEGLVRELARIKVAAQLACDPDAGVQQSALHVIGSSSAVDPPAIQLRSSSSVTSTRWLWTRSTTSARVIEAARRCSGL